MKKHQDKHQLYYNEEENEQTVQQIRDAYTSGVIEDTEEFTNKDEEK